MKQFTVIAIAILAMYGMEVQAQNLRTFTYRGQGAFSISYPSDWEVVERPNEMVRVAIYAPIAGNNNSRRTNLNVISSKKMETLERLFQIQQDVVSRNKQVFSNYNLVSKEDVTINGIRGLKVTATWSTNGARIKGILYILKKADDTTYNVTFTIFQSSHEREIEDIIQSFKAI